MVRIGHQLEYLAALTGLGLARSLPASVGNAIGVGLGRLVHTLLTSRRRLAYDNMKQALGADLDEAQLRGLVRSVFEHTGRTLMELGRFGKLGAEGIRGIIDPDGIAPLRAALEGGRGAILTSAHFGNWELMGVYPAAYGIPTDIVVLTQHNQAVNSQLLKLREATGNRVLQVPANTRQVFKALKDNRLVVMAADQHAPAGTLQMDFLGRRAAVVRGPALFAVRCDCPIIPMLTRRERYDCHKIITGETILPPRSGDEDTDVRMMTSAYIGFLEENIRRYPDQWLWTHNRWKLKPVAGNSERRQS